MTLFVGCTQMQSGQDGAVGDTTTGGLRDYDQSLLANAETGDVVLFFAARWCTTCQALKRDINQNAADIPEDLTILELDYDQETELRQKYGVVLQHTLVQVDSDGNLLKLWNGGNTLETIIQQIT